MGRYEAPWLPKPPRGPREGTQAGLHGSTNPATSLLNQGGEAKAKAKGMRGRAR